VDQALLGNREGIRLKVGAQIFYFLLIIQLLRMAKKAGDVLYGTLK
jgi:uncharacterized membrane protein